MGGPFEVYTEMLEVETAHYIKGMHNLMSAHFDLQNHQKMASDIERFEKFSKERLSFKTTTTEFFCFQYLYIAKINQHFIEGTFSEGLRLVPHLKNNWQNTDRTSTVIVVLYSITKSPVCILVVARMKSNWVSQ